MSRSISSFSLSRGELLRKSIHMAVGLGAFGVVFLGPVGTALLTFGLSVFNVFVWPRLGGRAVWRRDDARRGFAVGVVLYPSMLLILVLIFWNRLEVVAAVWAILAFGDGMATIAGQALTGTRRLGGHLPWNSEKSWVGSLAFWIFGTLGAAAALSWTRAHQQIAMAPGSVLLAAALTAMIAAGVESWPSRLDDNLTVPPTSAVVLWGLLNWLR